MDLNKLLRNVHGFDEYILASQESNKVNNLEVHFNMSTILALNKIRSFEIEYFIKSEANGFACTMFEHILCLPPSKTWEILGKELVNILQYWLEAIRKHLITQNINWWMFLKLLLKFLKEIRQKDACLPNLLVKHTTECLLELTTSGHVDAFQILEMLHCLNLYCSESCREIRFAMRNGFEEYFIRLSSLMSTCGFLPCQFAVVETLVRWLVPREDRALRASVAAKWFPPMLYPQQAVDLFLGMPWHNFFKDARSFLNAVNCINELIISAVCIHLSIGTVIIISGSERQEMWLDVNTVGRCLSVLLEPALLARLGAGDRKACEALIITEENTHAVHLHSECQQLTISVTMVSPPQALPSAFQVVDTDSCNAKIVVSSRCDANRLHTALQKVFGDKYQAEESRFSHPENVRHRRHSGFMSSKAPVAWKSPSTSSTTSLALLHDRLTVLPRYNYDKHYVNVCVKPQLSSVTEVTETEDNHSLASTIKFSSYGVCASNYKNARRKAQSDSEVYNKSIDRHLSPAVPDDNDTSCLLVASIGLTDESIINDTLQCISKSKDNIVDLLVQEALQTTTVDKGRDKLLGSGINIGDNKTTLNVQKNISEAIEDTAFDDEFIQELHGPVNYNKQCTIISKSTSTDESNTEAINESPINYVNVRRKNLSLQKNKNKESCKFDKPTFDVQTVEDFFNQNSPKNCIKDVIISPIGFDHIEIIECVNSMVDKVCDEFVKCDEFSNRNNHDILKIVDKIKSSIQEKPLVIGKNKNKKAIIEDKGVTQHVNEDIHESVNETSQVLKPLTGKKRRNKKLNPTSQMCTILEADGSINKINDEMQKENVPHNNSVEEVSPVKKRQSKIMNKTAETDTPLMRRKRKLYSPKDEQTIDQMLESEDVPLSEFKSSKIKTPNSTTTCYKEIEKERKKLTRKPYRRKSKTKIDPPSPRTVKINQTFDKLLENEESAVKVTLADKTSTNMCIYNFTSDSEDEEFENKKIVIRKRMSTTPISSFESTTRYGRSINQVNYSESKSSVNGENNKRASKQSKRVVRKQRAKKRRVNVKPPIDLLDERMRLATPDVLNTSLVIEKPKNLANKEPELVLVFAPKSEIIAADNKEFGKKIQVFKKSDKNVKSTEFSLSLKKVKNPIKRNSLHEELNDNSPLPGLVIESVPTHPDDTNVSVSANMLQEFKKMYQNGTNVNETNTTHNLLSDLEQGNYSTHNKNDTNYIEDTMQIDKDKIKKKNKEKITMHKKPGIGLRRKSNIKLKPRHSNIQLVSSDKNEIINIAEIDEIMSEKSIETVGITAHGDVGEAPPNPELIEKNIQPRDLELEDLNHVAKDYFNQLTAKLNQSSPEMKYWNGSKICYINNNGSNTSSEMKRTPIVLVPRLSSNEIDKMLCINDDSHQKNDDQNKQYNTFKVSSDGENTTRSSLNKFHKWLPSRNESSSETNSIKSKDRQDTIDGVKSPVVSITRLSSYELHKWLPSLHNSSTDQNSDKIHENDVEKNIRKFVSKKVNKSMSKKSYISIRDDVANSSDNLNENLRVNNKSNLIFANDNVGKTLNIENDSGHNNVYNLSDDELIAEINNNSYSVKSKPRPIPIVDKSIENVKMNKESIISPIRFDASLSYHENIPEAKIVLQSDDKNLIHNMTNILENKGKSTAEEIVTSPLLRSRETHSCKLRNSAEREIDRSDLNLIEIDCGGATLRRKSSAVSEVKKRKRENVFNFDTATISESGPSVSSVNNWFRRNELMCSKDDDSSCVRFSMIELMQNVMEKLDTTLTDNNRNSTQRWLHYMVEVEKLLDKEKEERRTRWQVMEANWKKIETDWKLMETDCQKRETDFMQELRKRASEVILKDREQKQSAIQILKEDVQAVLEHINKFEHIKKVNN